MSRMFLNVNECAQEVIKMSKKKGNTKLSKVFLLGFMAGIFIGLGYVGYLTITSFAGPTLNTGVARFIGACVFPVGLMFVLLVGGSLFTGNNLITLGWLTKDITLSQVLKNWVVVWIANLCGSLFMVFLAYQAGALSSEAVSNATITLASHKVELTFTKALASGFLCNVVVAIAVWMSFSATDGAGKILAIWFPIMLFAFSGYQHVVANMFVIPMGYVLSGGEAFSILEIFKHNLIPVTIGNALAGGVFVPVMYYNIFLKESK